MDETPAPRRRRRPAKPQASEPEAEAAALEPAPQASGPAAAEVQPGPAGTTGIQPAPSSQVYVPPTMLTCGFCASKQPLASMAPWGTSYVCTDQQACDRRARESALYPMDEREAATADLNRTAVSAWF